MVEAFSYTESSPEDIERSVLFRSYDLRIPCCVDVPERYIEKARYGVRMLLLSLRVEPRWTDAAGLTGGGIYYGSEPERADASAWRIGLLPATIAFFDGNAPGPPSKRIVTIGGREVPVLFEGGGDADFDLVAACFYLLSGWQEWRTRSRDEHGRFPFAESVQERLDFITLPAVELYRQLALASLRKRGLDPQTKTWGEASWSFCPTHDVDYLRKWRPGILYREIVTRGTLNRGREPVRARVGRVGAALSGLVRPGDPYRNALSRIRNEVLRRGGKATYFFKAAARGPYDVGYAPDGSFIQQCFLELRSADFEIALHPSYHAYNHGRYVREEQAALSRATGLPATSVRTHYLRFDPGLTPVILEEAGFRIDSTLAFAEKAGFRRGTCLPFPFYDLATDRVLDLWEMPLSVMESTLFNRERLNGAGAREATRRIMEICRAFDGVFVGLWHNILWDESDAPGWGAHFTATLDEAAAEGARIDTLRGALQAWR